MMTPGRPTDARVGPAGDAEPVTEEPRDPHRWRILAVTLSVGFMSLLDVTIVNVALPSMRAGLDTSTGTIQWVVSGYALAFGLTLVSGGRLGDAYGRRRLMLVGLTGFLLASACAGLAPNAALLVVARLVQGAAAGLLTPQSSGLIQQLFRRRRARARVRALRDDGRALLGAGPGPRGPDHPGRRRGGRLAPDLPDQRADRAGRPGRDRPAGPRSACARRGLRSGRRSAPPRRPGRPAPRRRGARAALPGGEPRGGDRLPLLLLLAAPPLLWAFVRWELSLGRARRAAAAGHRRCCAPCPATPTGWPSAVSTSPGSPASSWCCRSSSRTAATCPRSRRGCCSRRSPSAPPSPHRSPGAW